MIKISQPHYLQMKQLLLLMNQSLSKLMTSTEKTSFQTLQSEFSSVIHRLESLYTQISEEFQDGKITKNSFKLQMESLQEGMENQKKQIHEANLAANKCRAQLGKVVQQNNKLKDYIRREKEETKKLHGKIQTVIRKTKGKEQKYEEKISFLEEKVKKLQEKKIDMIGDELDKELENLTMLQKEMNLDEDQLEEEG